MRRFSALVVAAGALSGMMTGVAAASPSPGKASNPPLSVLQAQAPGHFAGYSLPRNAAASVPAGAVPLARPAASTVGSAAASSVVYGLDVSSAQGTVNWATEKSRGARSAYVKATEGSYYTNPDFASQYNGSHKAGLIRGAYAFANPSYSSGTTQADYFVAHGGKWSDGGKTLPGALDIEFNPYGKECYGLSQSAMRTWVSNFVTTYHSKTTRWPAVYTNYSWWVSCTGNWNGIAKNDPVWIARYSSSAGSLPSGYSEYRIWQYASSGKFVGDQDVFNGSDARLVALAK